MPVKNPPAIRSRLQRPWLNRFDPRFTDIDISLSVCERVVSIGLDVVLQLATLDYIVDFRYSNSIIILMAVSPTVCMWIEN